MGTPEADPFDAIASAIVALHVGGGDDADRGFDLGRLPDAFAVDPPNDIRASNVPEVRFKRSWQLESQSGVMDLVLRRSAVELELLWQVAPLPTGVRFWVELSCPEADVRPSWFLLGAPSDDGAENEFSVSAKLLGVDVLRQRINVRVVPE